MATFVLIHGAWHGGWCFDQVKARLEACGHEVMAPDLPGMSSSRPASEEELAAITLAGWARFVADLCENAKQKPVILAAHSRGGVVISQAAELAFKSIDALVYVCAMMLPDGMSRSAFKAHQVPNPAFEGLRQMDPSGHFHTVIPERAVEVFAQLSPPDAAHAALARLVPEPSAPTETPLNLSEGAYGSVPRHYVECLHDRTIPIEDQRTMQKMQPCTSVTALEADHSPFLSDPEGLANALLKIATMYA